MNRTKTLVYTALFAALTCALTTFPHFPIPALSNAYIHLGDAVIIISVLFIGKYAIASAAVGSCIADLMLGAAIYSPATFIIKGLMALSAFLIFNSKKGVTCFIISAFIAEALMVIGYFLYESILYGASISILSVPFNLIQAVSASIISCVFYFIIKDSKFYSYFKAANKK